MSLAPRGSDVFVIGGGPAGLAAAIALRRRGFDVTVADCSAPPIDKACGEGIMPDGIAAARALGIALEDAGAAPFPGIRFCAGANSVEARFPNNHGLGLRRTALHELMVRHAADAGVRLAWRQRIDGIAPEGVCVGGNLVRARWIVGADGGNSVVRRWAGLEDSTSHTRRYGFRRDYRLTPWTDFMEIHWGEGCQLYITPLGAGEVCVVLVSRDPRLRLDEALPRFPEVARRLQAARANAERGGVSASRSLRAVYRGNVALVGDASGSVDAITGEGLCLLFQHAEALAGALVQGDLAAYQKEHRRVARAPQWMAAAMLLMDRRRAIRSRAMRAMARRPQLFAGMLRMHVGKPSWAQYAAHGLTLGCHMLTV